MVIFHITSPTPGEPGGLIAKGKQLPLADRLTTPARAFTCRVGASHHFGSFAQANTAFAQDDNLCCGSCGCLRTAACGTAGHTSVTTPIPCHDRAAEMA